MDGQAPDYMQVKTAKLFSIIGIAAYGFIRLLEIAVREVDSRFALGIGLCCGGTAAAVLLFMYLVRDNAKRAFYVPFITFAGFTAGSIYLKDFEYYFMFWLSICGTGCLYRNFKKLLSFFITSNVIIFFLFLFGFFTQNTGVLFSQTLSRWIFAVVISIFFLAAAKFSSEKESPAAKQENPISEDAESAALIPVEYDTSGLITGMVQSHLGRIQDKSLVFVPEIDQTLPGRLVGDEPRIKQILHKLLSNAVEYTGAGKISLSVRWKHEGDRALLIFIVRDTGMGIKPEDMDRLFSAAYSPPDAGPDRDAAGEDLSLSRIKGFVEMMGGTISVESEYGRGSAFTVTIPQGLVSPRPSENEVTGLKVSAVIETHPGGVLNRVSFPVEKALL